MNDSSLEFLSRPGCHLCEEAEPLVRRAAALAGVSVVEVDVDSDPELAVDWGVRIPVVRAPSGQVLAEGRIDFLPLLAAILRWRVTRVGARRG